MAALDTFHFKSPVLGRISAAPDSWTSDSDGVEFAMRYLRPVTLKTAKVTVFVPWSNIAYEVKSQEWD